METRHCSTCAARFLPRDWDDRHCSQHCARVDHGDPCQPSCVHCAGARGGVCRTCSAVADGADGLCRDCSILERMARESDER